MATAFPMSTPDNHKGDPTPILRLPNELLRELLSYVLADPEISNGWSYHFNKGRIRDSPVLAVRAVCRTFREVADELPFWYSKDFNFFSLIPYTSVEKEEAFLKSLLTDRQLVHTLRLRTHWEFRSIGAILTVLENVPSFIENTTSISLPYDDLEKEQRRPTINDALSTLAICRGVKSLDVRSCYSTLNLDILSNAYSQLENLSISCDARYKGTMEGLSNLKELRIRGTSTNNLLNPLLLLPMNSAATLTTLKIAVWSPSQIALDTTSLDSFVNLTTLHIHPISESFCDFICRTKARLLAFNALVYCDTGIPSTKIISMLSARSLQSLQELYLAYFAERDLGSIIAAIVKLPTLRRLALEMDLDLRWYRHFSRLANLDELYWKLREKDFIDASFGELGIDIRSLAASVEELEWLALDTKAKLVLLSEFAKINRNPRIEIEIGWGVESDHDIWDAESLIDEDDFDLIDDEDNLDLSEFYWDPYDLEEDE